MSNDTYLVIEHGGAKGAHFHPFTDHDEACRFYDKAQRDLINLGKPDRFLSLVWVNNGEIEELESMDYRQSRAEEEALYATGLWERRLNWWGLSRQSLDSSAPGGVDVSAH